MHYGSLLGVLAITMALSAGGAAATDSKYPDLKGQWERMGTAGFDPAQPSGRRQQPPLTAEYRAIWDAHLAKEASGSQTYNPMARCIPTGMPPHGSSGRYYQPLGVHRDALDLTYIQFAAFLREVRRIYTDGRVVGPVLSCRNAYSGYSIGKWIRFERQRPVRRARGQRDPRPQGPAHPRERKEAAFPLHYDNQDRLSGADRARAARIPERPARRDHDHRSRLHASLDGDP